MEKKDVQFEVAGYSFTKRAGKGSVYKVHFKSGEGHTLTLVSDSRGVYEGFPLGDSVNVRIAKGQQRTMDEIPEGS